MRSSRELGWPDLVWSHFSRPRFGGFDERVAAAAEAGFRGIGLYVQDYRRMRDEEGRSAAELRDVLARHDMVIAEAEIARGWWAVEGSEHDECVELETLAYELADEFDVRYLQVVGGTERPDADLANRFGALCDRAADHGLLVGIEWLPFTFIPDAAAAQRIVETADRPNGGYCADIWHHVRGANSIDQITALDPRRIFAIQMSDGSLRQTTTLDYKSDCMASRLPPGDGEFDCAGFLTVLRDMGVTAPISVELCSTEWWVASEDASARVGADAIRGVLAQLAS